MAANFHDILDPFAQGGLGAHSIKNGYAHSKDDTHDRHDDHQLDHREGDAAGCVKRET